MLSKEACLAFFSRITIQRHEELRRHFFSFDEVWQAPPRAFTDIGWSEGLAAEFVSWRATFDAAGTAERLAKEGIRCVLKSDLEYPALLREVFDPPFCLFVRGTLGPLPTPLAVVGTRAYTPYGKQVAEDIVTELVMAGVTIVSGLALGIDGIAHAATVDAGGRTIAVLGAGVDRASVYPAAHTRLAEKIIAQGGAVVSEYPPGSEPTRYSFPRRNRIVAGMSVGVLVVEAGDASGALITASYALDHGREIFAVPQNVTSRTAIGSNRLLQYGAHVVTEAQDILDVLHLERTIHEVTRRELASLSPIEEKILSLLSREGRHIDVIIRESGLTTGEVTGTLSLMELEGKVRNVGGMKYVRK